MNKEFIPYEQALALRELGFNEPCLGYFSEKDKYLFITKNTTNIPNSFIKAPLYQQAFRWLREKYVYHHNIYYHKSSKFECRIGDSSDNNVSHELFCNMYIKYEEAEIECLKKIIELCKNN